MVLKSSGVKTVIKSCTDTKDHPYHILPFNFINIKYEIGIKSMLT